MTFEWDERKAGRKLAKHGVPFEYAARVFWTQTGLMPRTTVVTTARTGDSLSA